MAFETREDSLRNRVIEVRKLTVKSHERLNLFARLPRTVALEFAQTVYSKHDRDDGVSPFSYALPQEDLEFLALEIAREDGSCIYVSYNGGSIDEIPSDAKGTRLA